MINVTRPPIDLLGSVISADHLKVNRSNLACAGLLLHKIKRLASPASTTMGVAQIEFVDKGIAPQIFQAVSEGQHDVADRGLLITNQPRATERRFSEKC